MTVLGWTPFILTIKYAKSVTMAWLRMAMGPINDIRIFLKMRVSGVGPFLPLKTWSKEEMLINLTI